jgi:hypothetical protein
MITMPNLTLIFYILGWIFVILDLICIAASTTRDSVFTEIFALASTIATILLFGLGAIIHRLTEIEEYLRRGNIPRVAKRATAAVPGAPFGSDRT